MYAMAAFFVLEAMVMMFRWVLIVSLFLITSCSVHQNTESEPALPETIGNEKYRLERDMSWQIQYAGDLDTSLDVGVYNLDLFETDIHTMQELKQRGVFVMCYFSAGSLEGWRPDAQDFPQEILGQPMEGWDSETWLDIRQIALLQPIMNNRLDMAASKGCDGVDPDNVNGFENKTGFPLSYEDQLAFNISLANAAHERGLTIGLKNDLNQIKDLLPYFDWILNEECFSYNECDLLLPFVEAGKPVFVIEYELSPQEFCGRANEMNFNALHKNWDLDAYRVSCR